MPAGLNTARLYSALLNTGLQTSNNALYQVIYSLIGAVAALEAANQSGGGGGGGGGNVTNNEFITSIIADFSDSGSRGSGLGELFPILGAEGRQGEQGIPGVVIGDSYEQENFWLIQSNPSTVTYITTLTGTQNDLVIPAGCTLLLCNNASLLTINGIVAGYDGQVLDIASIGAGNVNLAPQNAGSSANYRLINYALSAPSTLFHGVGTARFVYSVNSNRWLMINYIQGDWIIPAFSSGDFTASGGGTWTVASGDRSTMAYYLEGRRLTLAFVIDNTSVNGAGLYLQIGNGQWGGFASGSSSIGQVYGSMGYAAENGFARTSYVRCASTTMVECGKTAIDAWINTTSGTIVRANVTFPVT